MAFPDYKTNSKMKFGKVVIAAAPQTKIGVITFTPNDDSELNDLTIFQPENFRLLPPSDIPLVVEITAAGTPDKCRVSLNGGSTWFKTGLDIDAVIYLPYGIAIEFDASTGHEVGDSWAATIYQFAAHNPQRLNGGYVRSYVSSLPSFDPLNQDTDQNRMTGSEYSRAVHIAGQDTRFSAELPKANLIDFFNHFSWVMNTGETLRVSGPAVTHATDENIHANLEKNYMDARCVAVRTGRNMAWHRLYGIVPSSSTFTFPINTASYFRISTQFQGIGMHDALPGAPVEISGVLGDETLTLPAAVLDGSITHIRRVEAVVTSTGKRYFVRANGLDNLTLRITAPVSGSVNFCTFYVTYVKASDVAEGTWAHDLDNSVEPNYPALKASQLVYFRMGGHVTGTTADDIKHVGAESLPCDLRGELQMTANPQVTTVTCADNKDDLAANGHTTNTTVVSMSFSRLVNDYYLQYISERPDLESSEFPISFKFQMGKEYVIVFFTRCVLTAANPQAIDNHVGVVLTPILIDKGDGMPTCFVRFGKEE